MDHYMHSSAWVWVWITSKLGAILSVSRNWVMLSHMGLCDNRPPLNLIVNHVQTQAITATFFPVCCIQLPGAWPRQDKGLNMAISQPCSTRNSAFKTSEKSRSLWQSMIIALIIAVVVCHSWATSRAVRLPWDLGSPGRWGSNAGPDSGGASQGSGCGTHCSDLWWRNWREGWVSHQINGENLQCFDVLFCYGEMMIHHGF